jgi:hypothetical protein
MMIQVYTAPNHAGPRGCGYFGSQFAKKVVSFYHMPIIIPNIYTSATYTTTGTGRNPLM